MTRNPLLNALGALLYIIVVSVVMFYGSSQVKGTSVIGPIAVLSLFTLSAAVMGYVFCYQPLQLFLAGKKKEAVDLFLKTVGIFGALTATILFLYFSRILR
ncbi:MAG: hypothetical protein US77_C0016G0010 [Microgenomates group bacterium GW2011_GWC1_38_14]|nr:MAG: hypothetical protein US02_C0020G0010 [Candidatus Levybacteria bacterium GW2011_GWA2_36_13]KKQ57899.1 MAG: hypothetical protein US77_C0016G0010 [Microgenomates group bacterium GW2011_GWC1_38_14]OGH44526.1 MAG: hypothetical protein A3I49_01440 [Candidatus Levybacteria bacterium RIFCSPLOWO2_02_FULL_37_11]